MAQRHGIGALDKQLRVDRGLQVGLGQPEVGRGTTYHVRFSGVVGRREQQHGLHPRRQAAAQVEEALFDTIGEVKL